MPERPSRVLIVTRNLPPLVGGMERLNLELARSIMADRELAVIGPKGSGQRLGLSSDRVAEVPTRPLPGFVARSAVRAIRMARRWMPGIVLAGSGLAAPMAYLAARACKARLVVYVHGLDLVVRSLPYRLFWLPAVRSADLVIANSRNTRRLALECGVPPCRVEVLNPGTDLPPDDGLARGRFRSASIPDGVPLLLSVGRLTRRKGIAEFVTHALPAILQRRPNAQLLVIGADATDAAMTGKASERARIEQAARDAGIAHAVSFMTHCDDAVLSDAYFAADVHVFPARDLPGDVEGFGMVAIEAAAHGLPTVAFDVGGVSDAIAAGQSGTLVAAGDFAEFSRAVLATLEGATPAIRDRCRVAAIRFGWEHFSARLRFLLNRFE